MATLLHVGRLKLIYSLIFWGIMAICSYGKDISLDYIGQQTIPYKYKFQGTIVGGLSSLDYDSETKKFVAISDDRSDKNPARFYDLRLDYDLTGFQGWRITDVTFIKSKEGLNFSEPDFLGKSYVDPEAIRFSPTGESLFWASEGHADYGVPPFVREMALDGTPIREFPLPKKYGTAPEKGILDNLAFEALTVTVDNKSLLLSTEGPLKQDGQAATVDHGAYVRFLQYDIETGQASHEYVYPIDPVHDEVLPIGNLSINGVVEILAVNRDEYIIMERSFSVGAGLSIRLYLGNVTGATDVMHLDHLKGASYKPVTKKLLLDLDDLGIEIDNIEGLSFGKRLEDGRQSLLLISDDNFRFSQKTQILVFAVDQPPSPKTPRQPHRK